MIRFPYRADTRTGVPRWRPLIILFVEGPLARRRVKGLLDTGSADTILPLDLATSLGIKLSQAGRAGVTWRGQSYPLQFGDVEFEVTDGNSGYQWQATVGFSAAPIPYILLGNRGCLQFFDATFCGKDLAVDLTINRSFSGIVL
ncbi:MAG: hypothetical protein ACR2FY_17515 [Pirellulaceae bacterium]